jgi:anti-sigma B factor antagonist
MSETASRLKVTRADGICQVEFADRKILDELCIAELQEELVRLADGEQELKLLLNFANVDHLSSAALGMLITVNKHVQTSRGTLKLSDIKPQIMEVFKITRLNRIFDIHPDARSARTAF